jgi:hypothetical protein
VSYVRKPIRTGPPMPTPRGTTEHTGGRTEICAAFFTDSHVTLVGKVDREGFARDGYKGPPPPSPGTSPFHRLRTES